MTKKKMTVASAVENHGVLIEADEAQWAEVLITAQRAFDQARSLIHSIADSQTANRKNKHQIAEAEHVDIQAIALATGYEAMLQAALQKSYASVNAWEKVIRLANEQIGSE